jgi:hypothetical protein
MSKRVSDHPHATLVGGDELETGCAGCSAEVVIDLVPGTARAGSKVRSLTYADPLIVVWNCPACGMANADSLSD